MASIDLIRASNGSGDAVKATVTNARVISSTTIQVDATTNWPSKFIATVGDVDGTGAFVPATVTVFNGILSGGNIEITSFAPGYTDLGNASGQIVVLKPTTAWANEVASTLGVAHNDNGTLNSSALAQVYPVGSTYFNKTNSTNPATLLGFGTWARLEGVVLGGRSETGGSPFNVSAGTIIGADTHTLTVDQIPSHRHTIPTLYGLMVGSTGGTGRPPGNGIAEDYASKDTTYTGGGGAHNNIQRTLVGYLWERTA